MLTISAGLFALALAPVPARPALPAEAENPYKKANVGDTFTYKLTEQSAFGKSDSVIIQTITEKTDMEMISKMVERVLDKDKPMGTAKIALSDDFDPKTGMLGNWGASEKLKNGTDKFKVGDKEYDCKWVTYKLPFPPDQKGNSREFEMKVWMCKEIPGLVKQVLSVKQQNFKGDMTLELTEFVKKK